MFISNGVVIHVMNIIYLYLNDVEIMCPTLSVETSISLYDCNVSIEMYQFHRFLDIIVLKQNRIYYPDRI